MIMKCVYCLVMAANVLSTYLQPICCPPLFASELYDWAWISDERMNAMHESQQWEMHLFRNRNKFCHPVRLFGYYKERCMRASMVSTIHHWLWNNGNSLAIFKSLAVSHNVQKRMCKRYCRSDEHLAAVSFIVFDFPIRTNAKMKFRLGFLLIKFSSVSLWLYVLCAVGPLQDAPSSFIFVVTSVGAADGIPSILRFHAKI